MMLTLPGDVRYGEHTRFAVRQGDVVRLAPESHKAAAYNNTDHTRAFGGNHHAGTIQPYPGWAAGQPALDTLRGAHAAVFGIGGVGGPCLPKSWPAAEWGS